jgi:hypothetical protein
MLFFLALSGLHGRLLPLFLIGLDHFSMTNVEGL